MTKQNILKRTAVVCAAAALLTCGGMTVSAAANDTAETAAVVETAAIPSENEVVAVPVTAGDTDDYDIVTLDTSRSNSTSSSKKKEPDWLKIILIALAVSVIGTGVTVILIYRSYKYNGMTEPYEFKNKAPLDLTEREDVLVDVHVTSRRIERDNNNR